MIAYYTFRILFEIITYVIPSLHEYTGKWFCYFSLFVLGFGGLSIVSHSLVIAIYKYVLIVHRDLIRVLGEDKASLISFWINLAFPATWAVSILARPNLPAISSIFNCLGKDVTKSTEANETSGDMMRRFFFCGFDDYDDNQYGVFGYVMNVTNILGCFLTSVMFFAVVINIIESFFYQRIFACIKR